MYHSHGLPLTPLKHLVLVRASLSKLSGPTVNCSYTLASWCPAELPVFTIPSWHPFPLSVSSWCPGVCQTVSFYIAVLSSALLSAFILALCHLGTTEPLSSKSLSASVGNTYTLDPCVFLASSLLVDTATRLSKPFLGGQPALASGCLICIVDQFPEPYRLQIK